MLDGLDEVAQAGDRRQHLVACINEFCGILGRNSGDIRLNYHVNYRNIDSINKCCNHRLSALIYQDEKTFLSISPDIFCSFAFISADIDSG